MKTMFVTAILLALAACSSDVNPRTAVTGTRPAPRPPRGARVVAAAELTKLYANSTLKEWDVRASVTGADCRVLFVETPVIMEKTMVEAMHYGTSTYSVVAGRSIDQFSREREFRGVAYRDGSGNVWTFGAITNDETEPPCG
jgi:hypothetical protein